MQNLERIFDVYDAAAVLKRLICASDEDFPSAVHRLHTGSLSLDFYFEQMC